MTAIVTLKPTGPLAAAGRREGSRGGVLVHSDTLRAALRCTAAEAGLESPLFEGPSARFLVSSVFPEVEGVRLYPRPVPPPAALRAGGGEAEEAGSARAEWGEINFVTEARLESLCEGRRVRLESEDVVEARAWGMPSERSLHGLPRPRVTCGLLVDRGGGAAERFERRRWELSPTTRLFFLARLDDPSLLAPLKELVSRLGEAGLGGGRSAGAGGFELAGTHAAPGFLAEPPRNGGTAPALLLSLYLPAREEAQRGVLDGVEAETLERGGWIHSGGPSAFRKLPVRMVAEGAVLAAGGGPVLGEVRDVAPAGFSRHPVWRDGRAFLIPYRGGT